MITVTTLPRVSLNTFLKDNNITLRINEIGLGIWSIYLEGFYSVRKINADDIVLAVEEYLLQITGKEIYPGHYIPILTLTNEDKNELYSKLPTKTC